MIDEIHKQEKLVQDLEWKQTCQKENMKENWDEEERVPEIGTDLFDKAIDEANQKLNTDFAEFLSSYFDSDE